MVFLPFGKNMQSSETRSVNEAETIRRVADELPRLLPNLKIESIKREVAIGGRARADLVVRARSGSLQKNLIVEVKSLGEPRMVEMAISQLRMMAGTLPSSYLVVAAPYVSERSREICRAQGVGYIDLAGDAFLQFGPVLVDRVGRRTNQLEKRSLRTILAPKATRVVRTLLQEPEKPTTISEIAQKCSLSVAGVYRVVDLLQSKELVVRDEKKRILVPYPRKLLLEWARAWDVGKNRAARYFSFEKTPEQIMSRIAMAAKGLGTQYAFTGMAGASLVAPFVRFEDVWVYVKGDQAPLVNALDLRPVSSGANVVLLEPYDSGVFAGLRVLDGRQVVSDVQLIVDLYTYPARGLEQAEHILEGLPKFREEQ